MALHSELSTITVRDLAAGPPLVPGAEELRSTAYEKLLPPLVAKVRDDGQGFGVMMTTLVQRPLPRRSSSGGSRLNTWTRAG